MQTIQDISVLLLGLFLFAWLIVYLSGEVSQREQNYKSVFKWMAIIAVTIPLIAITVKLPALGLFIGLVILKVYTSYRKGSISSQ